MPIPYILEDKKGNNYVDRITRKRDGQGQIYYEIDGRNTKDERRRIQIYDKNVVKAFIENNGDFIEALSLGVVHTEMQKKLPELLNYFDFPETLNFTPPYIISDSGGDNYVDSVTRKIDKNGQVYYELKGRTNNNEERIIHLYEHERQFYLVEDGVKKLADRKRLVHQQMEKDLEKILSHFSISKPLNFINPALKPEIVIPKKPPAIIPPKQQEELPAREFFIAAAQRALALGDTVSSKQKGVHFTRGALIGTGSSYYDEGNSTRLNLFHDLVDGTKDGYYPFAATTAYGLSLLTYIASNYDQLNKTELHRLYSVYKAVAGDVPALDSEPSSAEYRRALAKGLKAEVNEITALRERLAYGHSIDAQLAKYREELIEGNPLGRPIVDKQTSLSGTTSADDALTRFIPSFFPIPPSLSSNDQIVLQAGGCRTHSAIVSLWKQGVDSEGNPVLPGDGKPIARYRVYRTVCNAGFGTTYDVRTNPPALYHEIFSPRPDGQTYSVCTQEVLLPLGVPYSDAAMQKQISKLIDTERAMLIFHDLPGKKGPNKEIGTLDADKQAKWRELNQSIRLGSVEESHSVLSKPQITGNCTVRSIEEYLRWELVRNGVPKPDANAILEKHWNFATGNDSATITSQLNQLSARIEAAKNEPSHPSEMNIVKAKAFFESPIFPTFPTYNPDSATSAETASLIQGIRLGKTSCPKPTMISIGDLLAQIPSQPQAKAGEGIGLHLLQGCDARTVPKFSCMQGSVRQVASQFNNGESKGRYLTQPDDFKTDPTQGPAEQRTSGGAALARYAHNKASDSFAVLLADPVLKNQFNTLFDYQYGYLTPKEGQEQKGVEFLKQHSNKIVLNVERVPIDGVSGQTAIQVLNSGLALGLYELFPRSAEASAHLREMTEILLTAQYKAVSAVAILEAQQNPKTRIPIAFTLVGGGAFGNDKVSIAKSVSQAINLIKESGVDNIDICLSIFNASEIEEYKKIAAKGAEFANLRALLNQKPINQQQLQTLSTLKVESIKENMADKPKVGTNPKDELVKKEELTPRVFTNNVDKELVKAMGAAINALSTKSHLSTESHQQKKAKLEHLLSLYQKSTSAEEANKLLANFVGIAAKQRESNWCSLFTSKFGETASAKAFFNHLQNNELKNKVLEAIKIEPKGKPIDFKDFAKSLRDKYEGSPEADDNLGHRL
ncbi:hypothetical protein [Legionella sp. km772]|uniref:hypothetical protein n=1 Tax=Legionella sp. km772 TaxID=2498111 RepID=UPI000F8CF70D|nr:hypothetical protein [Legionella sp. km772]RUR13357.1 hypothetical protein ELY15_02615 [Legionella sp. km772]